MKRLSLVLATIILAATGVFAAAPANDNSGNYGSWTTGGNGGSGFGAWTIIDLGFTTFGSAGSVGINLRSGTNEVITLSTTGSGDWILNDGGSDLSAGATATPNTPFAFSLTYNGGSSYSFTLTGSAGGVNFSSSNAGISSIDNLRVFNFNQGPGANLGFDNLAIVPEPSTLILLSGPALLGGLLLVRRRRRA